jgi:1,4-alpha-glucan branching enzyme
LNPGGVPGVSFAVWAPNADGVSVVGDFNNWDGRLHQMRRLGASGIWEIFVPEVGPGAVYKYEMHRRGGLPFLKADPYALFAEVPPATSSIVFEPR